MYIALNEKKLKECIIVGKLIEITIKQSTN